MAVTCPVGPAADPTTLYVNWNSTKTACPTVVELGELKRLWIAVVSFVAFIDWLAEAAKKLLFVFHFAVRLQVPVPLIMVTVVLMIEQAPLAVMVPSWFVLLVAVTMKVDE